MLDRRTSPRRRTLLSGHIEVEQLHGWNVDCAVRNLGEGGACLALPENTVVPSAFQLEISDQPPRPARLVWYGEGRAGVAFSD